MIEYNYCPKCSKKLILKNKAAYCEHCKISYYHNSKPCASVLIINNDKVLLARRARDPRKGELDIIGGFLEYGEDPKAGALREVKEETGLEVKIINLLGVYSDSYGDGGDATLNIHYVGEIISGQEEARDDIFGLEWFDIDKVPVDQGFKNTQEGLRDLKKWFKDKKI